MDFTLGAPRPLPRCKADTAPKRQSLHSLMQPDFVLGAPVATAPECESEDEWIILSRQPSEAAAHAPVQRSMPHAGLPECRDWQAIDNNTLAATREDRAALGTWRHVLRHKRLQKKRKLGGDVALVLTAESRHVEETLRPGMLLFHSAATSQGGKPTKSSQLCTPLWSGLVAQKLLPQNDLYGSDSR